MELYIIKKHGTLYNKDLKVYCTIYYNNKLMLKEF